MKKYRIPKNTEELQIAEGLPYIVIKELIKIDNEWQIIEKLVSLEEIK